MTLQWGSAYFDNVLRSGISAQQIRVQIEFQDNEQHHTKRTVENTGYVLQKLHHGINWPLLQQYLSCASISEQLCN